MKEGVTFARHPRLSCTYTYTAASLYQLSKRIGSYKTKKIQNYSVEQVQYSEIISCVDLDARWFSSLLGYSFHRYSNQHKPEQCY
jgi:hypothetical protein